jgi:hypothetical protein
MADEKKAVPTQTDADKRKAEALAEDAKEAAQETKAARAESKGTLKDQEGARPEPSQDECNEIRRKVSAGEHVFYKTRQAKAK